MKRLKKSISFLLAIVLLATTCMAFAGASYEGEKRVVIGADLDDSQIETVYGYFGIKRGDVTELTVTNSEEREYLNGLVSDSAIGTRSISCVYIELLAEGKGLSIETNNINWCDKSTYQNALVTAGITDAKVIVAAPFEVSGTAALTGIYKAYEDITGKTLDANAKSVATEELVTTSDLADQIGSADATEIVNQLKQILDQTKNMTDDELKAKIQEIADQQNVTLTDDQISQLITLVRQLETLDTSQLMDRVQQFQNTLKGLSGLSSSVNSFFASVGNFFSSIGDFFANLFK